MTPPHTEGRNSPLFLALLAVLGVLAWLLCHPYQGFFHDANLYALQALARIDPEALSNDVFLQHGSQDRYTVFSPIYAGAITLLGLDHAAAMLTALSQAGLCAAAWWLARTCLPRGAAAAGVVLLLALPGEYGPLRVFTCVEPFLTPRMAAEALTLGALAAAWHGRRPWAAGLMLLATLLHPVMALAGAAALFIAWLLQNAARNAAWRALTVATVLLAAGLGASLLIGGRFDTPWLKIVEARSPYLFMSGWTIENGIRAMTGLVPLAAGALVFEGSLRRASLGVLLATIAGWLATFAGADLLHAVTVAQAQPWRIEWLACASSALLLPALVMHLAAGTDAQRSAALLIVAALIFRTQPYAAPIGASAILLLWLKPSHPRYLRLVLLGALALCGLAVLWRAASDLELTDLHYLSDVLPLGIRRAMSVAQDGLLFGALIAFAWWLHDTHARSVMLGVLLVASAASAVYTACFTLGDWLAEGYPATRVADFESWRAQVPPQAQVLWNSSPLPAWALLHRSNYLSGLQTSGVVFSRAAALEMQQRAERLSPVIAPASFLEWDFIRPGLQLDATALTAICRLGVVDYLATEANLTLIPTAAMPALAGTRRKLKLYRCADPR